MTDCPGVWSIRPIQTGDVDLVNGLLLQAELPELTSAPGPGLMIWGAFAGSELLASVALETHGAVGLLRSLVVAPAGRGRGIGAELTARVEERARYEGLRSLYLLTTTATDFFAALGYRPLERANVPAEIRASAEFTGLCPASADCFHKELRS